MHKGSCLCGRVTFEVAGEIPPMHACHCSICRKASGHYGVGADISRDALKIHGEENIKWFQTSDWARRGFCATCGTPLFFDPIDKKIGWTGVSMGAFDKPTNTKMTMHIFTKDKGDYYEIVDGLPQHEQAPVRS